MSWRNGFRRLHRRYERKADHVLAFVGIAAAIVDRLTFDGTIIETGTDSYRRAQTAPEDTLPAEHPVGDTTTHPKGGTAPRPALRLSVPTGGFANVADLKEHWT